MEKRNKWYKDTKVLTSSALLVAMGVIFGFFKIPITSLIEIRFQMLPVAVGGMLFGSVPGGIIGALTDVLAYLVKPTGPFFPGFTISSAVAGILFGAVLKKNATIARILISQILYAVIIGIFLNSWWLHMLYGTPYVAVLLARLPKELLMIPVNTVLMTLILKPVHQLAMKRVFSS